MSKLSQLLFFKGTFIFKVRISLMVAVLPNNVMVNSKIKLKSQRFLYNLYYPGCAVHLCLHLQAKHV